MSDKQKLLRNILVSVLFLFGTLIAFITNILTNTLPESITKNLWVFWILFVILIVFYILLQIRIDTDNPDTVSKIDFDAKKSIEQARINLYLNKQNNEDNLNRLKELPFLKAVWCIALNSLEKIVLIYEHKQLQKAYQKAYEKEWKKNVLPILERVDKAQRAFDAIEKELAMGHIDQETAEEAKRIVLEEMDKKIEKRSKKTGQ